MMRRVLLRAPVFTQSGYGVHARQIAKWLLKRNNIELSVQALPWGTTPWSLRLSDDLTHLYEIVDQQPKKRDVSVQLQLPSEWDPSLSEIAVGVTAGVETDRAPAMWAKACDTMTRVIVPSEHSKSGLVRAGADPKKISVVPESFTEAVSSSSLRVQLRLPDVGTFGVLIVGQLTHASQEADRKNILNAVRWTREALKNDKEAFIVLKTNMGRNTAIDATHVRNVFSKFLAETCPDGPKLVLLHGDMADDEIAALYRHERIKCYVSLTRGEGFGLPTLEAAASGLPVIATDWSAHSEYLGQKWSRVSKTLVEIPKSRVDGAIFVTGARWAEPDADSYKKQLLRLRESYRTPLSWATETRLRLLATHSQESIERHWDAAIGDLL